MRAVLRIAMLLVRADPQAVARGTALSVVVLLMGAALLGLSGWFITATGLAGLAGIGIAFDVFRPSAGVRFLALGRAAARYGERLLTHDATLRALAALRVVLMRSFAGRDAAHLMRLRGEGALTRIISDVDALDGVMLRLVLPIAAALMTHALVFAALVWLVGLPVAAIVLVGYLSLACLILVRLARGSLRPSAEMEEKSQDLRRGIIDMIRDREALILAGQIAARETRLMEVDAGARDAARRLDRAERDAAMWMSILVAGVAMGALLAGAWLLGAGMIDPALAVIGVFVALALAETLLPLRRGVSDLGRMVGAAQRVAPQIDPEASARADLQSPAAPLLVIDRGDANGVFHPGEAIALTGPSGVGKSTLLLQIAGLLPGKGLRIKGVAPTLWAEAALRAQVSVLPQRSALIAGTIRDNLCLAGEFGDTEMWTALDAVALSGDVADRGGLDARLGEGGKGLSGGQARRLCLARVLLARTDILLLDEPTEGLDPTTAQAVLTGLRDALPDALIIAAMHRGSAHGIFDRTLQLRHPTVTMSPSGAGTHSYTGT
ncbi:putative ABC transporter ATP-binding protein [Roseivivax sp. THAF40]|uniref:amino acid ABC transporter ATP-binding/permease protein n=1 Tax=unclassified Roseivivax TaxID=2639302 RepID=UPI0012685A3E|nr:MULTISPECIES: ATP-binding cassette domain-containing protein [unclassified Roseivivax]QFS84036.1 putative ABC transporter ATP-binding protein [Roseivivax sp. THAF197b]QFT47863.1 putative ABC transporter ATP-binding protein [Roseivivax sp. THAF40]